MGNNLKSRLHLHKRGKQVQHENKNEESPKHATALRNQVDQAIMNNPSRAAAEQSAPSTSNSVLRNTNSSPNTTESTSQPRGRT